MNRRAFISLIGGAMAWPLAARAQRPSIPVIGFLDATLAADTAYRVWAFRDGLKEAGFIDGHNVAIEFRWAENKLDRLPDNPKAKSMLHLRASFNRAPARCFSVTASFSTAGAGSWRRSPRVMVCLRLPAFVSLFWPAV